MTLKIMGMASIDEEDPNLILDLPPLMDADLIDVPESIFEPPRKAEIIESLTWLLIEAEENRVFSFAMIVERSPGTYKYELSGCDNPSEVAGKLLDMAIIRLGYATRSMIPLSKDDDEAEID